MIVIKKILILITFVNSLFTFPSKSCFEIFFSYNENIINNPLFLIEGIVNDIDNNYITIYIEKNKKIRIDYNEQTIISDEDKIINFKKETNQLFIEKSDSLLNSLFFSLGDFELFYQTINQYINFKHINIFMNDLCTSIDSIIYNNHETMLKINSINIDTMNVKQISLFNLKIDEKKVFIYDFR